MTTSAVVIAASAGAISLATLVLTLLTYARSREARNQLEFAIQIANRSSEDLRSDLYSIESQLRSVNVTSATTAEELEEVLYRARQLESSDDWIVPSGEDTAQILSEISHSLNTPLAQIEAAVQRASTLLGSSGENPSVATSLANARSSVDLCRCVLTAYRDLYSLSNTASRTWDMSDLHGALRAIWQSLFEIRGAEGPSTEGIAVTTKVSSKPRPYSNYLICSIMLPLLQNAIEATPAGGSVEIEVESADPRGERLLLRVSNTVEELVDVDKLNDKAGHSSKDDSHSGLGIQTVRTLVRRIGQGPLYSLSPAGEVVADVILGKGAKR